MQWMPTHRLVFAATGRVPPEEVMAYDLGVDHAGPGRYALFTRSDWERGREPDWAMDSEGRVWFRGDEGPTIEAPRVESLWDSDGP